MKAVTSMFEKNKATTHKQTKYYVTVANPNVV